jgi:hypothetical protein
MSRRALIALLSGKVAQARALSGRIAGRCGGSDRGTIAQNADRLLVDDVAVISARQNEIVSESRFKNDGRTLLDIDRSERP